MQVDFSEVYKQYAKRLYLFIFNKCMNSELAEDVVQTAFLKAIQNIDSFHGNSSIYTWITKIALNVLYEELQKPERNNLSFGEMPFEILEKTDLTDINALDNLVMNEERSELYSRISRLNKKEQEIVNLRLREVSFKEIGEKFKKSENWAKVNYHRAVKKLKEMEEQK